MKLLGGLLLPVLFGAASASSDAHVYIFQGTRTTTSRTPTPPALSPEQARLVFAQRLGASQHHGLGRASEDTISYINQFGGNGDSLFDDAKDKTAELVLIVEGVSERTADPLLKALSSIKPAFNIKNPPSMGANKKLVADLMAQTKQNSEDCPLQKLEDAINPFDSKCWDGKSKILQFDLGSGKPSSKIDELMDAQKRLLRFAEKEEMNVVVVLMPQSSRSSKASSNPYGAYEKASQMPMGHARRGVAEEPMTEPPISSSTSPSFSNNQVTTSNTSDNSTLPFRGLLPSCYLSLDDCIKTTRNCSGHGACYKKFGSIDQKGACFACGCAATNETFLYNNNASRGFMLAKWGGSACQKRDVSEPFWLISAFTIVMVGLVSWGIGLMFSIGEEKLPGVIGAGVSSKAR